MKAHVSNGAWEIIRIDNKLSIGNKSSYSTAPVLIKLRSWYGLITSWKTTHKMAPTLAASMHQYSLWKKPSIRSMVTENQTHFPTFTSDLFFPNCYEHKCSENKLGVLVLTPITLVLNPKLVPVTQTNRTKPTKRKAQSLSKLSRWHSI